MTLYILLFLCIIDAALLCHWRLNKRLPQLGKARLPSTSEHSDAYLALLSIAHHDIWWAEEHAWTIVTYLIGAIVAVVVVDVRNFTSIERSLLAVVFVGIGILAIFYAGRMQSDMAGARIRSAYLVRRIAGLQAVLSEIAKDDRDYHRGSYFMLFLALATAGVSSIAVGVLRQSQAMGWICIGFLSLLAPAMLYAQVKSRADKASKLMFDGPEKVPPSPTPAA